MFDSGRPQSFWLLKGAILGAGSGAAVGAVLMISEVWGRVEEPDTAYVPDGWADAVAIGVTFGGFFGILTGLLVGAVMAVLMSDDLTLDVERRRALVLGTVLSPLALCAVVGMFAGGLPIDNWRDLVVTLVPGLLGGPLARWATRFRLPGPPVS